ncbi:MAG: threonylcarbamoyl-AMP synthase [Bacteroidales bacterium]|nr:threonylcarbamoyl-AMP synthase [Bacteroidales bacterium]
MDFEDDIRNALTVLHKGGTLLYPTDTVWGLGCDATNYMAVNKVYGLKRRVESKSLIILLESFESLSNYVKRIPDITYDLLDSIDSPVTIIYSNAWNLPENVIAKDGTIGIRIVKEKFCQDLIRAFGRPIVSTSANISGEHTPSVFNQISEEIKNDVDYVVKYKQDVFTPSRPSTIIRLFESGHYTMIRN